MSFILDALRKSEDERRRDAVPGISRAPMAVPRDRLPRWAVGVMVALALGVFVLGAAWWWSERPDGVPLAAAPPVTETAREASPAAAPVEQGEAAVAPEVSTVDTPATAVDEAPAGVETFPDAERQEGGAPAPARSVAALTAPAESDAPSSRSPSLTGPLPSLGEIRAQGIAVPALELQLHSWGGAADERFVFINGTRYVEGDEVEDDLRVVAIRRDGAVLRRLGRDFLLVPE